MRVRSERGRTEFDLVRLVAGPTGWLAFPVGKGSGSVTTFARADGFFRIPADLEFVEAGTEVEVTPLGRDVRPADLVVVGSHCLGLDTVLGRLAAADLALKVVAVGSRGGIEAARLGACHLAPIHLLDPATGTWNAPFAPPGTRLVPGYGRRQGLAHRPADAARFEADDVASAIRAAAADPARRVANRNRGSGTRQLVDDLLGADARPAGWATGYRSHTAVAAAIAQGRADWGICLEQAAAGAGLAWRPWREERYDFLVPEAHADGAAVAAFRAALEDPETRALLRDQGFDA